MIAILVVGLATMFLALFCFMLHLINDNGREHMDDTIRGLRRRECDLMQSLTAEQKAHGVANIRLETARSKIADLNSAIEQVGVILGFTDGDEEEEEKDEEKEPPPPPAPKRYLYACSVISACDDEYDGNHSCWLIRATSRDEARGIICRLAEAEYPDGYEVEWAGDPIEPEKT